MDLFAFNPGLIFWTLVTFIILLVILKRVAWKPLLDILEERERTVREALDGAEKARKEADDLSRKNEGILGEVRLKSEEILAQAKTDAERVRAEILEKSRKESQAVLTDGKRQLEREHRAALQELRSVVADLAVGAAEKILSQTMDREKQGRLVEEYLQSLPEQGSTTARKH